MDKRLPPNLPPNVISQRLFKVCYYLMMALGMSLLFGAMIGCQTKSKFVFEDRVHARPVTTKASGLLKEWKFYDASVISTTSGCSNYTSYQSDSYVIGDTVTTTTYPVERAACFKGDDLTKEQIKNYKLLKIALTAKEMGATSFFRLGREYWVPLTETSYQELDRVFVANEGDEKFDVQTKAINTILIQAPYKKVEVATSTRYFYHTKLNEIIDENQVVDLFRKLESESDYEYKKRMITWKPINDRFMSSFDPEGKGIEQLIQEGILVPSFHTEEALIPIFPKPLNTEEVIRSLSE